MLTIGIVALQGAFQAHQKVLNILGVHSVLVKDPKALAQVDGLIFPGGESTAMIFLMHKFQLWDALQERISQIPVLATCAGVILLQKLSVLAIHVQRNGYGRQLASGVFPLKLSYAGQVFFLDGFFIRAPIIQSIIDPGIQVWAYHHQYPVCIQKSNILATTFHPELSASAYCIHKIFLEKCRQ